MEMGVKKEFSIEVSDSIIAEFKVSSEKKNQKSLKQKREKPNWWSNSKGFLEKPCNMGLKV